MKNKIIISFLACLSILDISCSTNSTNPQPESNSAVFPNVIGDTWVYAVYDSLNSTADTLTVKVAGIVTTSDRRNLMVWTYSSKSGSNISYTVSYSDTLYVYSGKDTVYSYYDRNGTQLESKIAFPLQVGMQWQNNTTGLTDLSQVTQQQTVTVPAGSFQNSFLILRNKNGLNDYLTVNTWFKERTGIVKLYLNERGFAFRTFTWNLINFTVH